MRKNLKSFNFTRDSEVTLGLFLRVPLLRFGYEIRWCFAVAHAPQSHAFRAVAAAAASLQPASSNQQPLKRWKKEYVCRSKLKKKQKSFTFTRDSEVTLSPFFGVSFATFGVRN